MPYGLEIRDPVHGFVQRQPHELKIIDTALFQRLRRIKQLALASLVYPGALHTRFEHSIGVMHIAGRIAAKLELPEHEQRILRLAALLHDIGHGPFSHVSEDVLRLVTGSKRAHEELTTRIIETSSQLNGPLSGDDREQVVGLLNGERGDSLMRSILSGPLDVDKQDYLLRDSYFCGVKYGVYDIDRLIETLRVCMDSGHRELSISEEGILTLEQFVVARYHMSQVYRHRVRLITDAMIVRGIELGIKLDGIGWLRDLYKYDGSSRFLDNYLEWDDDRLTREILGVGAGYAYDIFDRLARRRLLKLVLRVGLNRFDPVARKVLLQEDHVRLKELLSEMEAEVADCLPDVDKNLVIARVLTHPSAQTQGPILVLHSEGPPSQFSEESLLFGSIDRAMQEPFLHIYAPISWADPHERRDKLDTFRNELLPRVNEFLKAKAGLLRESTKSAGLEGGL